MGCTGGYAGRLADRSSVAAMKSVIRWGLKWTSRDRYGVTEYLIGEDKVCVPALFRTRAAARAYREEKFGYIRERADLRAEPHGWRMPKVIRIEVKEVKQ